MPAPRGTLGGESASRKPSFLSHTPSGLLRAFPSCCRARQGSPDGRMTDNSLPVSLNLPTLPTHLVHIRDIVGRLICPSRDMIIKPNRAEGLSRREGSMGDGDAARVEARWSEVGWQRRYNSRMTRTGEGTAGCSRPSRLAPRAGSPRAGKTCFGVNRRTGPIFAPSKIVNSKSSKRRKRATSSPPCS